MTDRRQELAEAATDYVLEHGLIGLTLRPAGGGDRHQRPDAALPLRGQGRPASATVLRTSNDRSVAGIRAIPPSRRRLAGRCSTCGARSPRRRRRAASGCTSRRAAVGVLGVEPYATVVAEANEVWLGAVADHLAASGVPRRTSRRAAALVDATFMGLQLDLHLDGGDGAAASVRDLADAVATIWAPQEAPSIGS